MVKSTAVSRDSILPYSRRSDAAQPCRGFSLLEERRVGPQHYEPKPAGPLKPKTHSELQAHWKTRLGEAFDAALHFETGAGPLESVPESPVASMLHWVLKETPVCEARRTGSCVAGVPSRREVFQGLVLDLFMLGYSRRKRAA